MSYTNPFPRIFLQLKGKTVIASRDFVQDSSYVNSAEAKSLINAARIIVKDFKELTDYVEPTDANQSVYSHRIYELLLRTATEFEANCKGILKANGYVKAGDSLNIVDYHKLNAIMKLDRYEIETDLWIPTKKIVPLKEWGSGFSLRWYKAYNATKHNRYYNFNQATLSNLFDGICSLVVILAAQFPIDIGYVGGSGFIATSDDNDQELILNDFTITYPTLSDAENYDFDWSVLSKSPQPFSSYKF